MQLKQDFLIDRPVDEVWSFFHDIPALAECLPGAEYLGPTEDGKHSGKLTSKIGPFQASFAGEANVAYDEDARTISLDGKGVDKKGNSRGKMTMVCKVTPADGGALALVSDYSALIEDCERAKILVTSLYAPWGCKAPLVIDRRKLEETGAITLRFAGETTIMRTARAAGEDRPWSPAPKRRPVRAAAEALGNGGEPAEAPEAVSGLDRLD